MTVRVTRDGNRLFGRGTGTGKTELFAFAENRFFLENSGSEITFLRNRRGEVTAMILIVGSKKTTATRIVSKETTGP
jgi:hypothetical protein